MISEEYRRQAAYANKQARIAKNDAERASWLWIARLDESVTEAPFSTSNAKTWEPGMTIRNPRIKAA
jgi:type VI protein secretion system component VasF